MTLLPRNALLAVTLSATFATTAAAAAEQRVYSGDEAMALKCAWVISAAAGVLQDADIISLEDREISIAISARILQIYVSGSDGQKLNAFQQVGDRRDPSTAVAEFKRQAPACLRRFPVD